LASRLWLARTLLSGDAGAVLVMLAYRQHENVSEAPDRKSGGSRATGISVLSLTWVTDPPPLGFRAR
jgi:hypothetical protein